MKYIINLAIASLLIVSTAGMQAFIKSAALWNINTHQQTKKLLILGDYHKANALDKEHSAIVEDAMKKWANFNISTSCLIESQESAMIDFGDGLSNQEFGALKDELSLLGVLRFNYWMQPVSDPVRFIHADKRTPLMTSLFYLRDLINQGEVVNQMARHIKDILFTHGDSALIASFPNNAKAFDHAESFEHLDLIMNNNLDIWNTLQVPGRNCLHYTLNLSVTIGDLINGMNAGITQCRVWTDELPQAEYVHNLLNSLQAVIEDFQYVCCAYNLHFDDLLSDLLWKHACAQKSMEQIYTMTSEIWGLINEYMNICLLIQILQQFQSTDRVLVAAGGAHTREVNYHLDHIFNQCATCETYKCAECDWSHRDLYKNCGLNSQKLQAIIDKF